MLTSVSSVVAVQMRTVSIPSGLSPAPAQRASVGKSVDVLVSVYSLQ